MKPQVVLTYSNRVPIRDESIVEAVQFSQTIRRHRLVTVFRICGEGLSNKDQR